MQDLTVALLSHGALLLGCGSAILAYILLRKKARESSPDCPILQIGWWRLVVKCFCAALLAGAIIWTISIAYLFALFTSFINKTCTTDIARKECNRAASDWENITATLIECGILAMIIILMSTYVEAKRTASPPERSYPLVLLIWSHSLLMIVWFLCTPIKYSLKVFSLVGTEPWLAASLIIAFIAILVYITGITLWVIAVVRVFFAWLRKRMDRSSGEEQGTDRGRDIELQDINS